MAHVVKDLAVLPAHPRVYPQEEQNIHAFAFSAEDGHHLPTHNDDSTVCPGPPCGGYRSC